MVRLVGLRDRREGKMRVLVQGGRCSREVVVKYRDVEVIILTNLCRYLCNLKDLTMYSR